MAECYFTHVKGTCSCRGCRYAIDPDSYDAGCRLPKEIYEQVVEGHAPEKSFYTMTKRKEVTTPNE